MNFSADNAARKWALGWHANGWLPMVIGALFVFVLSVVPPMQASAKVPLPRPRPAEAPAAAAEPAQDTPPADAMQQAPDAAKSAEIKQPFVSPCRLALTEAIAIAPSIPPIRGPGACGGDDLVRLEAIVLSPTQRVTLKPAAILRCTMASAVADWIRTDMTALAAKLGTTIRELDNFDSFECRGRNRVQGAKLSEHGLANALDVRGLTFANGATLSLTDRAASRELREQVLTSVCMRFSTVLGPGSDWYHEDHIHLDLAQRRNNYKLCQWGVYESLPAVAPLLPAERPAEAPPRPASDQPATAVQQPAEETVPEASGDGEDKPAPASRKKASRRGTPK